MAPQEDRVGKTVACHMLGRNAVPAAMLDGHAGLLADRLEADLDLGLLARREGGLAPGESRGGRRAPTP